MKVIRDDERLPCPKSSGESHIPPPSASNAYSGRTSVSGLSQMVLKSCLCDARKAQFPPAVVYLIKKEGDGHLSLEKMGNHLIGKTKHTEATDKLYIPFTVLLDKQIKLFRELKRFRFTSGQFLNGSPL